MALLEKHITELHTAATRLAELTQQVSVAEQIILQVVDRIVRVSNNIWEANHLVVKSTLLPSIVHVSSQQTIDDLMEYYREVHQVQLSMEHTAKPSSIISVDMSMPTDDETRLTLGVVVSTPREEYDTHKIQGFSVLLPNKLWDLAFQEGDFLTNEWVDQYQIWIHEKFMSRVAKLVSADTEEQVAQTGCGNCQSCQCTHAHHHEAEEDVSELGQLVKLAAKYNLRLVPLEKSNAN